MRAKTKLSDEIEKLKIDNNNLIEEILKKDQINDELKLTLVNKFKNFHY